MQQLLQKQHSYTRSNITNTSRVYQDHSYISVHSKSDDSKQVIQRQTIPCMLAVTNFTYILTSSGINNVISGDLIKRGGDISFEEQDGNTHEIELSPTKYFSKAYLYVKPLSKVSIKVDNKKSPTNQEISTIIKDKILRNGKWDKYRYQITLCP